MPTTAITTPIEEYKGFEIHDSQSYPKIYVKGSRKIIWEALDIPKAKQWIDELLNWMCE